MAALATSGCTFTFNSATFTITSISVESPQAEIVDMTQVATPEKSRLLAWTGDYASPGRIDIEGFARTDPISVIGTTATAVFGHGPSGLSISRKAICESATTEARVGDLLRFRMSLVPTDL